MKKRWVVFMGIMLVMLIAAGSIAFMLETKFTPFDPKVGQWFGYSVSISGDTAVVGASWDDHSAGSAGAAYVFERNAGTWSQQQKLIPVETGCAFCHNSHTLPTTLGYHDVVVSGDTVVVGGGNSTVNVAHVFVRSGTAWTEQQRLVLPQGTATLGVPMPIAISGDTMVLGTPGGGTASVYVRSGSTWAQQQELTAADGATCSGCHTGSEWFGRSVAVSGDTTVIGASWYAHHSAEHTGKAYVYVRSEGAWTEEQGIVLPVGVVPVGDRVPLAISGDTMVMGATGDSAAGSNSGAAYVYVRTGTAWSLQQKLTALDAAAGQEFGYSVSIEGEKAVIGAATERAVYIFERTGSGWSQKEKIVPPSGGTAQDSFPLAISGDTVVIGAAGDNDNGVDAGAAYVYDVNTPVDLSLSKVDDVDPAPPGSLITYTLTVTNNDVAVDATGVTVTDTLPAGWTYQSASLGCAESGGTVICVIGTIPAGGTRTVTITASSETSGTVTNTATVSADQTDPDPSNNTASETTTVNAPPTISTIPDQVTNEDPSLTIDFTVGDIETAPGDLIVTAASSNGDLVPPSGLHLEKGIVDPGDPTRINWTLTITSAANQFGSTFITLYVSDLQHMTPSIFKVTVNPVNDAPNGTDNTVTTLENTDYTFGMADFGFSDVVENHAFQAVHITTEPGAGTLTNNTVPVNAGDIISTVDIAAGNLVFTPASNESGIGYTSFTFQVQDDGGTANGGVDLDPTPNTMAITVLNTPTCTLPTECPDGVQVTPIPDVTVTFTTVTAAGQTSGYETAALPTGCPGTENFKFDTLGTCYDVSTTAQYGSPVEVCFTVSHDVSDPALKIMHFNEQLIPPDWEDVTTTRDTSTNTICGNVDSFSWFVLGLDTPLLSFSFERLKDRIWPPNRKLVHVATVKDVLDAVDPSLTVDIQVTYQDVDRDDDRKDEGDDRRHKHKYKKNKKHRHGKKDKDDDDDHNHAPAWEIRKVNDTWEVWVRAERSGKGDRVYAITTMVTDASGNKAAATHTVRVPHDKGKR